MNIIQLCHATIQRSRRASRRRITILITCPCYAASLPVGSKPRAGTCGKSDRTPLSLKSTMNRAMRSRVSLGPKCWGDGRLGPLH